MALLELHGQDAHTQNGALGAQQHRSRRDSRGHSCGARATGRETLSSHRPVRSSPLRSSERLAFPDAGMLEGYLIEAAKRPICALRTKLEPLECSDQNLETMIVVPRIECTAEV